MTFKSLFLLPVLLCLPHLTSQTAPTFCSYSAGVYTCDYGSMVSAANRPIDFTLFNPVPQRLLVMVNGYVPFYGDTQTFSTTFSGIDVAVFDPNFPAMLTLDCGWGGSLFLESGAFYNMSYVQHLKIKNCNTYNIPSQCFADFVNLDFLGFEGGMLDTVDPNGMAGVSVEKLTSDTHQFPQHLGHFEVRYTPFQSEVVPPGLLFSWKNLTSVTLRGDAISTLSKDTFKYNTKLRYIDLSDNTFTSLPNNVFSGLPALSEIHLYNINWTCSCDNNWCIEYADTNNITLYGDLVCTDPSGITVQNYWYLNCVTEAICGTSAGIVMSGKCVTMLMLSMYIVGVIAFIVVIVSLALAIHTKRTSATQQVGRQRAQGRWNKVMSNTKGKVSGWNAALKSMKK